MRIDKLALLGKGWKASEIEKASAILEEAEGKKDDPTKILDKAIFFVLGILILINTFVCALFLVPFIYTLHVFFAISLVIVTAVMFGFMFSFIIADVEKLHPKKRGGLMGMLLTNGILNSSMLWIFSVQFSRISGLIIPNSLFFLVATYLIVFLIPQAFFELKRKE